MINAEKYAEQIAVLLADCCTSDNNQPCDNCPLKDINCADKESIRSWILTQCE